MAVMSLAETGEVEEAAVVGTLRRGKLGMAEEAGRCERGRRRRRRRGVR